MEAISHSKPSCESCCWHIHIAQILGQVEYSNNIISHAQVETSQTQAR